MRGFLYFLLILCQIGLPAAAMDTEYISIFGGDISLAQIKRESKISVVVLDQVTDGCWLNAERTKSRIDRELLDAGFLMLVDESAFTTTIYISANGYEAAKGLCAVSTNFSVYVPNVESRVFDNGAYEWLFWGRKEVFSRSSIMTGPQSGMSARLLDSFSGFFDEFIVAINAERNLILRRASEAEGSPEAKELLRSAISR